MGKYENIVKSSMANTKSFKDAFLNYEEALTMGHYEAWLFEELNLVENDIENLASCKERSHIGLSMINNQGFIDESKIDPKDVTTSRLTQPNTYLGYLKKYEWWVKEQLKEVRLAYGERLTEKLFSETEEERISLQRKLRNTRSEQGDLVKAQDNTIDFIEASKNKTAFKEQVLTFIRRQKGHKSYRNILGLSGWKTEEANKKLDEVLLEIARELDIETKKQNSDPKEMLIMRDKLFLIMNYKDLLLQLQEEKEEAREQREEHTKRVSELVEDIKEQNQKFIKKLQEFNRIYLVPAKKEWAKGSKEIRSLKDVEQIKEKITELDKKKEKLEQEKERIKGEIAQLKLKYKGYKPKDSKWLAKNTDFKKDNEENTEKQKRLKEIDKELVEVEKIKDEASKRLDIGGEIGALTDVVLEQVNFQRALLEDRDLLKTELSQIKSKVESKIRGIKVYTGFSYVTYPFLLQIGNLVAATGGGALGAMAWGTSMGLQIAEALAGGEGLKGIGNIGTKGLVSVGALRKCKDYGTGSLSLCLYLGISVGFKELFDLGLALKYEANINVGDDRKFRSAGSLAIVGSIEAKLKKVIELGLEGEIASDETEFEFNDVYQWAAWVAQKWANTVCWVTAATVYQKMGNKLDAPNEAELMFMKRMAESIFTKDSTLREMFEKIDHLLGEEIVRADSFAFFTGMEGSAKIGEDILGAEISLERRRGTKCYKREIKDERLIEKQKTTYQSGKSLELTVFGFSTTFSYSNIGNHPNPDNDGSYINLTLSTKHLGRKVGLLGKGEDEGGEHLEGFLGKMTEWGEKLDKSLEKGGNDQVKNLFGDSDKWEICHNMNFSTMEICFFHADLKSENIYKCSKCKELFYDSGKGGGACPFCKEKTCTPASKGNPFKKWVLLYIRKIYSMDLSADVTLGVPHFPVNLKAGFALEYNRTYSESLGDNSIAYIFTIYNGLMSIPSHARPEDRYGEKLFERYAEDHAKSLWKMCKNIKKKNSWIRLEISEILPEVSKGNDFIQACESFFEHEYNLDWNDNIKKNFMQSLFPTMREYLEANKTQRWEKEEEEGWSLYDHSKITWSLNPYALVKNIMSTKTQQGILDSQVKKMFGVGRAFKLIEEESEKEEDSKKEEELKKENEKKEDLVSIESNKKELSEEEDFVLVENEKKPDILEEQNEKKENPFLKKQSTEKKNPFLEKSIEVKPNYLLTGHQALQEIQVTGCTVSQSDLEDGRSACNGISTYTALEFLLAGATGLPGREQLEQYMTGGIQFWKEWYPQRSEENTEYASTNDMIAKVNALRTNLEICPDGSYFGKFSGIREGVGRGSNISLPEALAQADGHSKASVLIAGNYSIFIGKVAEDHWVIFDSHSRNAANGLPIPQEDGGVAVAIRCNSLNTLVNQLKQMYGENQNYDLDFVRLK